MLIVVKLYKSLSSGFALRAVVTMFRFDLILDFDDFRDILTVLARATANQLGASCDRWTILTLSKFNLKAIQFEFHLTNPLLRFEMVTILTHLS